MKNREAIETFNVLSQLNNERGLPIKFEYGVVKLQGRLEKAVKTIQVVRNKKIEGQEEYDKERTELLVACSDKDENGNPVIVDNAVGGSNYKISDMTELNKKIKNLDKKHENLLAAVAARNTEIKELLDADVEDFVPYNVNVKYLPVDKDGCSRITPLQLTHLMPFLEGDIDDLPDFETG